MGSKEAIRDWGLFIVGLVFGFILGLMLGNRLGYNLGVNDGVNQTLSNETLIQSYINQGINQTLNNMTLLEQITNKVNLYYIQKYNGIPITYENKLYACTNISAAQLQQQLRLIK